MQALTKLGAVAVLGYVVSGAIRLDRADEETGLTANRVSLPG